ncbi:hypothetical protein M3Y94_00458000 [Aphelenchoides besseyi]|nr:hypothetical protein M3Y94_00458000 [Aphelenchoides besseyi]
MDPVDIPDYLFYKNIHQLIMFSGLDVNNNPTHNSIYSAFLRIKRINYKLLTADYEQPLKTEKSPLRSSRGLLKRDWPLKYLNHRPALIVLFVDLNWNHPSWSEKKMECESKIASLRQSVAYRETRIILVLIQTAKLPGSGEDSTSKDRAVELGGACQLSEKQLYIFPQNENHDLVASRLDGIFYENGLLFYQAVLRKVRSRAIPNNHNNLLIRQQFKLGFLSEMRQDTHSALRPYKQAYQTCLEVDIPDSELYEYMSVIALLNYKVMSAFPAAYRLVLQICEISFLHDIAKDAVNQFRRHMNVFAARSPGEYPSPLLASIEMLKWKSKQCKMFADLFYEKSLAAYAHENPGLHFEMAADFLRQANTQILSLTPTPDAERTANKSILVPSNTPGLTVFFGQRPWRIRQGVSTALDPRMEHAAKVAIENTCQPNYRATIQLWTSAIRQFQTYRCGRMERAVKLQIAEECMYLRDFNSAAKLIRLVILEFRREKVFYLLHQALLCSLDIAYCRADINEYMWSLSQLLNSSNMRYTIGDPATKAQLIQRLMDSYVCLTNGTSPPQSDAFHVYFSNEDLNQVRDQWIQLLGARTEFSTNLSDVDGHVEATAGFITKSSNLVTSGDTVIVQVTLRNRSTLNLSFNARVLIHEGVGHVYTMLQHDSVHVPAEATIELMIPIELRLSAPARQETNFYIKQLFLDFVPTHGLNGNLRFDFTAKKTHYNNRASMGDSEGSTSVKVVPVVPKLNLQNLSDSTVLLGETAILKFALRNDESYPLRNVSVNCRQLETDDQQPPGYVFPSLEFESDAEVWQPRQSYEIVSDLASQFEVVFNVPCRARCCGKIQLQLQIIAVVDNTAIWFDGVIDYSFNFAITCLQPFSIDTVVTSSDEEIEFLFPGHLATLKCSLIPTFNGELVNLRYELDPVLTPSKDKHFDTYPIVLSEQNALTRHLNFHIRSMAPSQMSTTGINIGNVIISWKRSISQRTAEIVMPLGSYPIRYVPLLLKPITPTANQLIMRQPTVIEYQLQNLSDETMSLKVSVERIDAFMFDGYAEKNINLLPKQNHSFIVTVIALTAGELPFPQLKIHCSDAQTNQLIQQTILRQLQRTVSVIPSTKNGTSAPLHNDEHRSVTNSPTGSSRSGSVPVV